MNFKKFIAFSFLSLISIFPSYGTQDIDQNFDLKEKSVALKMKENYENAYNNIITGIKNTQEIVNTLYIKFQTWNSEQCGVTFSLPPDENYLPDEYFQYAINVLELKKKKILVYYETFDQVDQFPKGYPDELKLYNDFIKLSAKFPKQFLTLVKQNIGKLEALFHFLDLYKPYVNKMIQTADILLCIYKNDEQIQINFDNQKGAWEKTQFYLSLGQKNCDPFSFHLDNVNHIFNVYTQLKNDIEVLRTNINNGLIHLQIQLPQPKKTGEKIEDEKNQTNESQRIQKNKEKKKRKRKNKKNKIKSIESVKQQIRPEAPKEESKNTIISEQHVSPSNEISSNIEIIPQDEIKEVSKENNLIALKENKEISIETNVTIETDLTKPTIQIEEKKLEENETTLVTTNNSKVNHPQDQVEETSFVNPFKDKKNQRFWELLSDEKHKKYITKLEIPAVQRILEEMKENDWIDYELQKMKRKEKISANLRDYEKPALTIHLHNGDKDTEDKGVINSVRNFIKDVLAIKNSQ